MGKTRKDRCDADHGEYKDFAKKRMRYKRKKKNERGFRKNATAEEYFSDPDFLDPDD